MGAPSHRPLLPLINGGMPTESGVPPLDLEARRRYYQRVEAEYAARMQQAFTSYEDRQYAIERYCVAEAEREVNAMLTGQGYLWRPFDERDWSRGQDMRLVRPLDCFEFVK